MSQNDFSLANASGAAFRADANAALQALASRSAGVSAPPTTYPNQVWADTTNFVLKARDSGNSAWRIVATLDTDRVLAKSAAYTVQLRDYGKRVEVDTTSAAVVITMPTPAADDEGFHVRVKNTGTGSFSATFDGNGNTINGNATLVLADGESAFIEWDGVNWVAIVVPTPGSLTLPRGYMSGLGISNNVTDAAHDIDIAVGECRDSGDAFDMVLAATLVKQIDAAFVAGTNAGGLFTGAVAAGTWYHVFLIRKISNGQIDAGFDTSVSAANIPAGWSAYRRLGAVLTDGSANILGFTRVGEHFIWNDPIEDVADTNFGTADVPQLVALSVPPGVRVRANIRANTTGTASSSFVLFTPGVGDGPPEGVSTNPGSDLNPNTNVIDNLWIETNESSQISVTSSTTNGNLYIRTRGYVDYIRGGY